MALIEHVWPWTQQPQEVARVDARWRERLVYANPLDAICANVVTGLIESHGSTTVAPAPWGVSRAFDGSSSSHIVGTALRTNPLLRTYVFSQVRLGAGGGGYGRVFDRDGTDDALLFSSVLSKFQFTRKFTGPRGSWSFAPSDIGVAATFVIAHDASSAANVPRVWRDGSQLAVTTDEAPGGTAISSGDTTSVFRVGNRVAGDRPWHGLLGHVYVFDDILTDEECAGLSACPSVLWEPRHSVVPVSAGGSAVPDITFVGADNILATSADYRVTLDFA